MNKGKYDRPVLRMSAVVLGLEGSKTIAYDVAHGVRKNDTFDGSYAKKALISARQYTCYT